MKTQKKAWKTPELIVIVRSKPEESVLATCKINNSDKAPGPDGKNCNNDSDPGCLTSRTS